MQNELINLLNPYNLIFWRKISNIILKNIFIILLHKKYIIKQNKSQSILIVLKSKDEKFKITDNKTKDIDKRIKIFQESLKHEKTNIKTDSHKSIIIFNEEGEAYINDSLSIGFLFYLREKSNKASQDNDIKIEELKILNEGKNGLIKVKEIKEEKDDDSHQIEVNEKEEEIINNKIIEIKKVGLNRKYEGKTNFTGVELIEMLKNPLKYLQKNTITNNLFDSVYKNIDDLKNEIGYNEKFKQIFELENECKDLYSKIKELMTSIEDYIEKYYGIKNIKEIKINENCELDLNEKCTIYSELNKFANKINEKMNYFKIIDEKFKELKSITNLESNINELINKMEEQIKKTSELIKLSDIIDEYKLKLINNIENNTEYKNYSNLFTKEKIDGFRFKNLFEFLETYLGSNNYSIL